MDRSSTIRTRFVKLHRQDIRQNYSLPPQPRSNVVRLTRIRSISLTSFSNEYPIIENVRSLSKSKPQNSVVDNQFHRGNSNDVFIYDRAQLETFYDTQQPVMDEIVSKKMTNDSTASVTRVQSIKKVIPSHDYDAVDSLGLPTSSVQTNFYSQPNIKIIREIPSHRRLVRRKLIFNDIKEEPKERWRRQHRSDCFTECYACCSLCCCLVLSLLLILLLLAGLITLLVLLLTTKSITTTDTESIIATDTTIQINTTTTTTSTITTTSITTTTKSSTSISTTSMSSTSITTIISTSATTTAATVTITSNTCTSGWKGVTVLYHCDNCPNISPYKEYNYTYTAISNQTRIAFSFREDTGCFALDNVSVRSATAPTIELIANNDFETGILSSWTYCNPQSASSAGQVKKNSDSFLCMGYIYQAKSGTHFYYDGAVGNCDYLIQQFATDIGSTYAISYWLYNQGIGSASSADVIISI